MKTTCERSCRVASLLAVLVAGLVAVRAEAGSTAAQVAFTHGLLAFEKGETEEAARLFAVAVENEPE
ncbi:MAG TPA: hypothetical protein DD490_00895, partial [Acidobacteria bacterium]|nr:hypothetical protein [Acidobacteriota bacterium]